MRIITAPDDISIKEPDLTKVFLAGGISNCPEWQKSVIELIKTLGYESSFENVVIYNPRRDDFNISKENLASDTERQIEWEFNRLQEMDIFSMYFCDSISSQPICFYELGRNILNMQNRFPDDWSKRIIITIEEGFSRADDVIIQTRLATGLSDLVKKGDVRSHTARIIKSCLTI